MNNNLIFSAWKRLITVYAVSFALSWTVGLLLINFTGIEPETLFDLSTKRVSYVHPVMTFSAKFGIDPGIMLFFWNSMGCLATLSFIYTAAWFNPNLMDLSPRAVRKAFSSKTRMKLLCHLPGCSKIDAEPLRRLYLWLLVPYFSLILLGTENGLSASTAGHLLGSLQIGLISLLPHGIIEIPGICLAGSVAYSAHLLIRKKAQKNDIANIFQIVESHKTSLPIFKIAMTVILAMLLSGIIEAHITLKIVENLVS